jgi:hypothetical protein
MEVDLVWINKRNEMKEEHKIIDRLKKQHITPGFSVPENYFKSLDARIIDKINTELRPMKKKIAMVIKPWLTLAAIFVLAFIVYYNTPYFNTKNKIAQASFFQDIPVNTLSDRFAESDLIEIIVNDDNLFTEIQLQQEYIEGLNIEDIEDISLY